MALQLTDDNFKETVLDQPGVALVDFWAEWCGPCRMVGPIVDELSEEYAGKVTVGKVDVDENSDLSVKYGVRSIPTILVLKDGEVVGKKVGAGTKAELVKLIEEGLAA